MLSRRVLPYMSAAILLSMLMLALAGTGVSWAQQGGPRPGFGVRFQQLVVGVFIFFAHEGGPADRAGIQAEDIIVAIDGQNLVPGNSLREIVGAHQPGDVITLSILRGGETIEIVMTLEPAATPTPVP